MALYFWNALLSKTVISNHLFPPPQLFVSQLATMSFSDTDAEILADFLDIEARKWKKKEISLQQIVNDFKTYSKNLNFFQRNGYLRRNCKFQCPPLPCREVCVQDELEDINPRFNASKYATKALDGAFVVVDTLFTVLDKASPAISLVSAALSPVCPPCTIALASVQTISCLWTQRQNFGHVKKIFTDGKFDKQLLKIPLCAKSFLALIPIVGGGLSKAVTAIEVAAGAVWAAQSKYAAAVYNYFSTKYPTWYAVASSLYWNSPIGSLHALANQVYNYISNWWNSRAFIMQGADYAKFEQRLIRRALVVEYM